MKILITKRFKSYAVGDVVDLAANDAAAIIALGLGEEVKEEQPAAKKGKEQVAE